MMLSCLHPRCIPDGCILLTAVYKVEGLKRDFNAHNKLIGQYRKVRNLELCQCLARMVSVHFIL